MIHITDKSKCCGCNACVQRCPKQCITMHEDEEGFLYPVVNQLKCIDCGLCTKVCPIVNTNEEKEPLEIYASQNKNKEIRLKSSSGGIFPIIASYIIENGGVVFGAKWNKDLELVHDYTEKLEDITLFCGSKYVQSVIGNCYQLAEKFLKSGRLVLFTGVPCQIAGLKKFLRHDYENLYTIDVICHGVPSPMIFKDYLSYVGKKHKVISFNFRDKTTGWKNYSISYTLDTGKIISHNARLDEFMRAFLNHYIHRPSCYSCYFKSGKGASDITLGDLWGANNIASIKDDDTGISLIFANTTIGLGLINKLNLNQYNIPLQFVIKNNPSYYKSPKVSSLRRDFWKSYCKGDFSAVIEINKTIGPSLLNVRWLLLKSYIVNNLKKINKDENRNYNLLDK